MKYQCGECGWIGLEGEMLSNHNWNGIDGDEIWSNWICPQCGDWHVDGLDDYEKIEIKDKNV